MTYTKQELEVAAAFLDADSQLVDQCADVLEATLPLVREILEREGK